MTGVKTINELREETTQEAFLEGFGNVHPELTGPDIDIAFREALRDVAPSEPVETLEKAMERQLGIVSDEEE